MYNWREKRERRAYLAFASGEIFRGYSAGAPLDRVGEVVCNTGMTGYQEIVSDPSYAGQIVTLTSPEIGNYGTNPADMESRGLFLSGLVVHELNPPSNFANEKPLDALLKEAGVPLLAGVDTRRLTLLLRDGGTQKAYLHCDGTELDPVVAVEWAKAWEGLEGQDYASRVSVKEPYVWNEEGEYNIIALDYGIKYNILRRLAGQGFSVTVVPAKTGAEEILKYKPDGVFLSNGPADPAALGYSIDMIRGLTGRVPIMGICLGHQLMGLALGAECSRLKFGHHGCNHPVKNLLTDRVEITSQNHNYALKAESLPASVELTHINLNDNTVEGIRHKHEPIFSIQYHPEAAAGPNDSTYFFEDFKQMMGR